MKIKLAIITLGILLASCGTPSIPVDYLAHINNNLSLENAKVLFEDYFDEDEGITSFKHNGKTYTALEMTRLTTQILRLGGGASGTATGASYNRSSKTATKYYLIFENDIYFFSGFRYEAVISPNKEVLQILDKATVSMMEEN